MRKNETDFILEYCLKEMEVLTEVISDRLRQNDIPVMGLFVEYWPTFIRNQIVYKVWNGVEHLVPLDGKYEVKDRITAMEILEVVRRRKILFRSF